MNREEVGIGREDIKSRSETYEVNRQVAYEKLITDSVSMSRVLKETLARLETYRGN